MVTGATLGLFEYLRKKGEQTMLRTIDEDENAAVAG